MRLPLFLLGTSLLLPGTAWAQGDPISLSTPTATLKVSSTGGSTEITGALPLTLPFSHSGGGCTTSGTATLAVVGGAFQIDADGGLGADCSITVKAQGMGVELTVPSSGDEVTHVRMELERIVTVASGGVLVGSASANHNTFPTYDSAAVGLLQLPGSIGLSVPSTTEDPNSMLVTMFRGDSISNWTWSFSGSMSNPCCFGNFDFQARLAAYSPASAPAAAAVPTGFAWLVAGIMLGLGAKVAIQRRV